MQCLPNPCNDILILDNHVTVFNVSIFFVCVVCTMYLFVGKLWFVDQKKSTVPVSHYFMMSEAHPSLNSEDQGESSCVWECPIVFGFS